MSAIKGKNTILELLIRKNLFKSGYRFRIHYKLPGKPDIVFVKKRKTIFIHGCFWHLHGCKLSTIPKSNTEFWEKKLNENKTRDESNINKLHLDGWETFTLWECEIETSFEKNIKRLKKFLD